MTTWRPILDEATRDRAWSAIRAVVAAVRSAPDFGDRDALTLFSGQPGIALLLAATARATGDEAVAELARDRIAVVAERALERPDNLFFMTGLTGVAWAIERVGELLGDDAAGPDDEDPHEMLDDAVVDLLADPSSHGLRFELMKGVAGLGIYALSRPPRPSADRCLGQVVAVLAAMAERTAAGASWFIPLERLPPSEVALFPRGCHSLGTVHGGLGPIAVLAGACARGVAEPIARPLLEEAIGWLWDQRQRAPAGGGWFAVAAERPDVIGTQGWCYGDPGTAAVLFAAGRAVGRVDWQAMALELARDVARRPPAPTIASDPMICHGATGVGHILNRLYQASGDEALRAGAVAWFGRALDQWADGRGIGGFATSELEGGRRVERAVAGLMDGSAGAALALLAAVGDHEPRWDRAFILSL